MSIIDKTEIKSEMIKKRIHNFYCDNCGEYLGAVKEYDDGYYHRPGEYNLAIHVDGGWLRYNQQLCEECRQQFIDRLKDTLVKMGFKPE